MAITNTVTSGYDSEHQNAPDGAFFIEQLDKQSDDLAEVAQFELAGFVTDCFTSDVVSRQIAATVLANAEPSELPGPVEFTDKPGSIEDAESAWAKYWMKPLLELRLAALGQRAMSLFDSVADIRKDPHSALLVSAFPAEHAFVEEHDKTWLSNYHLSVRHIKNGPDVASFYVVGLVFAPPLNDVQPYENARTEHALIHDLSGSYYGQARYRRTGAEASRQITSLGSPDVSVAELAQVADFADSLELGLTLAEANDNQDYYQKIRQFPQSVINALQKKLASGVTESVRYDDRHYPAQPVTRTEVTRPLQPHEVEALKARIEEGLIVDDKTPRIKPASPASTLVKQLAARFIQPTLFD